ncbi:MAG: thioredoxin domain-containing protein, partial [Deltaproteobacteria bacterium]
MLDQYPDKVKLVVKNFPLSRHRFARKAAQAAMAANSQGKFWAFRRALFEHYQDLNNEKILEIAKKLKFDMDRFVQDMNSASVQDVITKDIVNGRQIGVRGTPTLFVNGKRAKIRTPFDLF